MCLSQNQRRVVECQWKEMKNCHSRLMHILPPESTWWDRETRDTNARCQPLRWGQERCTNLQTLSTKEREVNLVKGHLHIIQIEDFSFVLHSLSLSVCMGHQAHGWWTQIMESWDEYILSRRALKISRDGEGRPAVVCRRLLPIV